MTAPPMRRRGRRRTPEAQTLAGCLELLRLRGWLATRVQSGRIRTPEGGWMQLGGEGTADIVACSPRGQYWEIEVKAPRGALRPAQRLRAAAVRDCGGVAVVVRSVEDLERCLRDPHETAACR